MADIVSKITLPNIGTYGIRSGYLYHATTTASSSGVTHSYTATISDSTNGTITVPSYEKGLTMLVNLSSKPLDNITTVRLRIGTSLGYVNMYYGTSGTVNPKDYITANCTYIVFYDGQYFRIVNSYYDVFKSGSNVLAASNSGSTNATSATANNSTYVNHVESGSVVSSVQVIGSGATTVSANNGVLTITSTGGTSTDEKLTVSTLAYDPKPIVMHDGGGSNGTGYTSPYLTFQRYGNDGSNVYENELIIGRKNAAISDGSRFPGSIFIAKGHGNGSSPGGGHIYPNSNTHNEHSYQLPLLDGEMVSSGGLVSLTSATRSDGIQNTTYYQCGIFGGKVYAPGMGQSGGGEAKSRYVSSGTWNDGTTSGPELVLNYSPNTFGTASGGIIPSASLTQSGVVTTGLQTFSGGKTFHDGLVTDAGITFVGNNQVKYQASQGSPVVTAQLPGISGTFGVFGSSQMTPDYLVGKTSNGYMTSNIAIGTDTTKFLRNDGTWQVPAGGDTHYIGTNVFASSAISTTNGYVIAGGTVYLNHVENSAVTSSLQIIGVGGASVTSNDGVLTIRAPQSGGGGYTGTNVWGSLSTSTTNPSQATLNNNTYLNHVENSSVTSSLQIIGTGNVSVSANGNLLTISGSGGSPAGSVSYQQADFGVMGAFVGLLTDSNGEYSIPIVVEPARPDCDYDGTKFSRQGVVKPLLETRGRISGYHASDYWTSHEFGIIGNGDLGGVNRVYVVDHYSECSAETLIALPIVFDYAYNEETKRYESVPYVLFPNNPSEYDDMFSQCFTTSYSSWDDEVIPIYDYSQPHAPNLDPNDSYRWTLGTTILDGYDPSTYEPQ